jgi:hypothetical protein
VILPLLITILLITHTVLSAQIVELVVKKGAQRNHQLPPTLITRTGQPH